MKRAIWTRSIPCTVLFSALLANGSAHAAPEKTNHKVLVNVPSSGSETGKYVSAWVDSASQDCASGSELPMCFKARAVVTGKVLNAQVEAVAARAQISDTKFTDPQAVFMFGPEVWSWSYAVDVFGTALVSRSGAIAASQVNPNQLVGQPIVNDNTPFTQKGVKNLSIDLGSISGYLGLLPNATVSISYGVNGGATTQVDLVPKSAFGPMANINLQPRVQMSASGTGSWNAVLAQAKIWTTDSGVSVLAPTSNAKLNVAYTFGNKHAVGKLALDLRALKGRVAYKASIDNPAFLPFEIFCLFDCDIVPITVASGYAWDSSTRYALYMQNPDSFMQVFDTTF